MRSIFSKRNVLEWIAIQLSSGPPWETNLGPRAHGTLSACHSPTRRGGRRSTGHRRLLAHAAKNAARRTRPDRPCGAARFVGYLCWKATQRRRIWSRIAPRPPGIPTLSAAREHPGSAAASRLCGLASEFRENGCSVGRRAGSARRLQPLKPSTFPSPDLSSFLVAWFVTLPPNFFCSQVCLLRSHGAARLRYTAEGVLHFSRCCVINGSKITRCFHMSSVLHALHFRSPSPRRGQGQLFTNLLLQASENVRLCQNMDVRRSWPMSTSWMMMSRFGWQWSETFVLLGVWRDW